jgi:hypothetical protein
MKKLLTAFLVFNVVTSVRAQEKDRLWNVYCKVQYTRTIDDLARGNNPWGVGAGLKVFLNTTKWFRPSLDLSGDLYLYGNKALLTGPGGERLPTVTSVSRLLAGPSLEAAKHFNAGIMVGPTFVNADVLFTIKPYVLIFMNSQQNAFLKVAYLHVYNRGWVIHQNFTSTSVSLGFRIF